MSINYMQGSTSRVCVGSEAEAYYPHHLSHRLQGHHHYVHVSHYTLRGATTTRYILTLTDQTNLVFENFFHNLAGPSDQCGEEEAALQGGGRDRDEGARGHNGVLQGDRPRQVKVCSETS